MAEPIVRKFILDTGDSEQKLKELGDQLKGIPNDLPKNKVPGDIVPPEAINNAKSLRAQLKELQAQLANTDPQTQKYRDLSAAAGELKDKISDAAQAVGTQAGGAFEKVSGSLGLVTSRLLSLDFSGAAEGAKLFAQNAGDLKLKDVSEGVKGLTSTLGTLGKALLTNPIFLLGTVLVGIIANFDALKASGGALGSFLTGLSDTVQFLKDSLITLSDALGFTNTKAGEEAEKAAQRAKEALADVKQFADQITTDVEKRSSDIIKASGGNLKQARERFKEYSDQVKEANQSLIDQANLIVERGGKLDEYQQQRLDAAIKENAALDKALGDINKSITEADQKAQDDAQKREEDRLRRLEAAGQRLAAIRSQIFEQSQKLKAQIEGDQTKPESAKSNIRDFDAELEAQRSAQDFSIQLMQEGVDKEIAMVDAKYAAMRDAAQGNAELLAQIAQRNTEEVNAIIEAGQQKEVEIRQRSFQQGIQLAQSAVQVLQAFSDASTKNGERDARKKFNTNKALAIGAATLQTASAVTGALTAGGNPIKLATGAQFVEAAIAGALGLAQIVKIKNTQYSGGGGGNDSNISVPSTPSATDNASQPAGFNPFAAQFVTNRPDQYLPRAYVLAGDVSSQQEVRENVEDLARIG
jgi:hypothetical protein